MADHRRQRAPDGPRPMHVGVSRVLRHLRAPEADIVQAVFDSWTDLVGDVIGAHSRPAGIADGTLVIEVDDPAWVSELRWMSDSLLEQIRTRLDTNEINRISVKLTR